MFKGVQESVNLINTDLEIIFSSGLSSNCNYNIQLALSDIYSLMTEYKTNEKNVSSSMYKNLIYKTNSYLSIL